MEVKNDNTMSLPKGYKQTSIGIIPEDWEVKKLENLLDFKNGINSEKSNYGSGAKFINVMEVIYNNSITDDMIKGSVAVNEQEMKLYSVNYGDIVFNRTSETTEEIGLSSVYLGENNKVVFGGFVIRGVFKNTEIDTFFKKFCFRSDILRKQIIKFGQGAVRSNIGQKDLEKVKIPLPSLPEQHKIAEILSTWDKAIETCQKTIAHLKDRNKGLAQQLLSGKKRVKGFENTAWEFVKFKDIYKPNKIKANENKYEILSVTKNGIVSQNEYFNRNVASESTHNYLVVEKGDFLVSGLNFWMGSYDVLQNFEIGMISPAYKVFRLKSGFEKEYFKHFVQSRQMRFAMISASVIGASIVRRNFDLEALYEYSFKIPSIEEQKEISKILDAAVAELKLYEEKLQTLQQQKKGLMQVLLTGKKRIKL